MELSEVLHDGPINYVDPWPPEAPLTSRGLPTERPPNNPDLLSRTSPRPGFFTKLELTTLYFLLNTTRRTTLRLN